MRSLCLTQPTTLVYQDSREPGPPGDNEVLVAIRAIGICGTDLSGYAGKMPFIQYPRILGHELGVEVLQTGSAVQNVKPGDRCSVEPYLNCGACHPCSIGKTNCCENLRVLGVHCDGGMTERLILPAGKLHPSKQLNFHQLALVETLAIGCHAVDRANIIPDQEVIIFGAGPIGLAVLEFARLVAKKVSVVEPNSGRRNHVETHFPDVLLVESPPLRPSAHVVFDATGNAQSMTDSLQWARFAGKIVFVGITTDPILLDDPLFHRRELTLLASRNALPSDFPKIIGLIERQAIKVERWITHTIPFENAAEAFHQIALHEIKPLKAVISGKI
jgi:2-desacetyl-2-hydroxyethyl bacteriochlorophyllide A dehydrogenase